MYTGIKHTPQDDEHYDLQHKVDGLQPLPPSSCKFWRHRLRTALRTALLFKSASLAISLAAREPGRTDPPLPDECHFKHVDRAHRARYVVAPRQTSASSALLVAACRSSTSASDVCNYCMHSARFYLVRQPQARRLQPAAARTSEAGLLRSLTACLRRVACLAAYKPTSRRSSWAPRGGAATL